MCQAPCDMICEVHGDNACITDHTTIQTSSLLDSHVITLTFDVTFNCSVPFIECESRFDHEELNGVQIER